MDITLILQRPAGRHHNVHYVQNIKAFHGHGSKNRTKSSSSSSTQHGTGETCLIRLLCLSTDLYPIGPAYLQTSFSQFKLAHLGTIT